MKKYIIALVAVVVVAAIGIYFGNPDLFQGRIFSKKTTTEKYIVKKGLCVTPATGERPGVAQDLTGTEKRTIDASGGAPSTEVKKGETPTVDPGKLTIGGSGKGTVAPGTPTTGNKDDGGSKSGDQGIKVTWQDCGCADQGKVKSEEKDSKGNIIKQTICEYKTVNQCLDANSEYKCPRGTEPDMPKIYNFCIATKTKQCFGSAQAIADDVSLCKAYTPDYMGLSCTPSKECANVYSWWYSGEDTDAISKKLNISISDTQKMIMGCISETVAPPGK